MSAGIQAHRRRLGHTGCDRRRGRRLRLRRGRRNRQPVRGQGLRAGVLHKGRVMKESRYNIWLDGVDGGAYVYNGVSGALLRIPKSHQEKLSRALAGETLVEDWPPELLPNLARGHMIVADDTDELALLSRRYEASRYDRSPLGLTIVTSLGCNLDCPYCFEAKHTSLLS